MVERVGVTVMVVEWVGIQTGQELHDLTLRVCQCVCWSECHFKEHRISVIEDCWLVMGRVALPLGYLSQGTTPSPRGPPSLPLGACDARCDHHTRILPVMQPKRRGISMRSDQTFG